ncbi:MAG: NAD(P)/FAD-dependent oxidoreductase [Burkholderiaceae bacterium]|nr:NAD(P)/FAD-dependent oxidoreductase [Burkholderiaceae bacterium]
MRIGIIGGGLTGLAVADRLAHLGHRVHVFESAHQPGGLATWHDFGGCVWDRFYHVILPSDAQLLGFIRDLGLADRVRWRPTQTGYYVDGRFYPLSTNIDFLRFPPLGPVSKLRLALTILYAARISDWRRLEKISVEDWLLRTSGRATFEKFWKPLLLAKLGENYRRVSAVFIWTYVKRLFSARDATAQREHLGYVSGGYRAVFQRLLERLAAAGGRLELGVQVTRIAPDTDGRLAVTAGGRLERFDKVVFTGPVNVLRQVADPGLVDVTQPGRDVEYLGVICMVLITRQPLVPYYVLNIGDESIPFTGIIGTSNVVDHAETNGLHVTYLPKYVLSDDPLLRADDEAIRTSFFAGLRSMFPDLDRVGIESIHINRAVKVQPLQVLDYSSIVPRTTTRHPNFFVLNSAQFVSNTLNNNEVIRNVNSFFAVHAGAFRHEPTAAASIAAPAGAAL